MQTVREILKGFDFDNSGIDIVEVYKESELVSVMSGFDIICDADKYLGSVVNEIEVVNGLDGVGRTTKILKVNILVEKENLTAEDIINYNEKYNLKLPVVEVDSYVNLFDIWDGNGSAPTESYCYQLENKFDFMNYEFKILNPQDAPEQQAIRVTAIELI